MRNPAVIFKTFYHSTEDSESSILTKIAKYKNLGFIKPTYFRPSW